MQFPKIKYFLLLVSLFSSLWGMAQFQIPEKPATNKQTSIYDYVNLLERSQTEALEQKLIRYSDSTSTQIVIAIIATTEGEDIQYLGAQWGQKWGIGQEQEDNGILILLAREDRRIGINTGYGVEEFLTDALSKRIIEQIILPEFRNGDYYGGLDRGADAIFQVLTGQFKSSGSTPSDEFPLISLLPFLLFIIFVILLASRKNKGGRGPGGRRGPDIWDMIILSNMGKSGSSGGFGSGGGFGGGGFSGGFGGGGFGGGGSSGGW